MDVGAMRSATIGGVVSIIQINCGLLQCDTLRMMRIDQLFDQI